MISMLLKNLKYVDENFIIKKGDILTEAETIKKISCGLSSDETLDMSGLTALPGFIDIHTHGGSGADTCDKNKASLETLSKHYAKHGVTSFCPTTMTLSADELKEIFREIEKYKGHECGAYIQGIHMEGPYISKEKCGAQNKKFIKDPDIDEFKSLCDISKVSIVSLAPETDGALSFANELQDKYVCSVAHTNANYEQAKRAFENGFSHVTHFFNAMSGLSHRAPGVVGAVFENNSVTAELICDGFHLNEATVRLAFKILGDNRCVAISDSLSCADCKDGEYVLGKQKVIVKDGKALLEDGTIAGSSSNLFDEFKNLLRFGIPFESALKSCSANPAKVLGVYDKCGSIEEGKNADIIFLDASMNLKHVMIKGKMIF